MSYEADNKRYLGVLVSNEMHSFLKNEAYQRNVSMGYLVREAIEASFPEIAQMEKANGRR